MLSGVRWPAEWEPHEATWLVWPHNRETWSATLGEAQEAFCLMVEAISQVEQVCLVVCDEVQAEGVARSLESFQVKQSALRFFFIRTNDSWVRDTGPIFVLDSCGSLISVDFGFDAWGGKYPPWDLDNALGETISQSIGLLAHRANFVLEGGSIDSDGQGTFLTTESCLLRGRKGKGRNRECMERRLHGWLGASKVIWLDGELAGDDTGGHVDDLARFVAPHKVVVPSESDPLDANYLVLQENRRRLGYARDSSENRLEVVELPMPTPVFCEGVRCPASYANFYFANESLLLPVFGCESDDRALEIFRGLLPNRSVIPIPARALVAGFGSVHCLTQQEPRSS